MMGIRQYARHRERLGLPGATPAAVRAAIKTGRLKASVAADKRRVKRARDADAEWAATTNADRVPYTGPTASGSQQPTNSDAPVNELATARARREAATAELAEIELAERRGELVRAHDVEARMADVFLRCRTRMLGVAPRFREQGPSLSFEAQVQLVEALVREGLEELATGPA